MGKVRYASSLPYLILYYTNSAVHTRLLNNFPFLMSMSHVSNYFLLSPTLRNFLASYLVGDLLISYKLFNDALSIIKNVKYQTRKDG
jgi:hypothetical protein